MSHVVETSHLTKRYGNKVALRDLTLNVPSGVTGLLGPNGSGKSTLIKALLGLVKIQTGSISVLGYSAATQIRTIRDKVGYMPEDDCFIAGLTGIESVCFMARLAGLPSQEGLRRSHEILDFSDVGQERYRAVETYSTGMRQKLKFAQTLVHDPDLLVFDEPTTGLDPGQRVAMLNRIATLARKHGKSILLSTHILHDVKEVCESVIILADGQMRVMDRLSTLSRPARSGLQVRVIDRVGEFCDHLTQKGLHVDRQADGSFWVTGIAETDCGVIWAAAQQTGAMISSMEPATNSLEQVFHDSLRDANLAAT